MLRTDNLVQWQLIADEVDAIYPWFTHKCLDVIKKWDLKDKRVLEFGGGRSTRWWRKRAAWVTTIDTNLEWIDRTIEDCAEGSALNGVIIPKVINEGDQSRKEEYVNAGDEYAPYDIAVDDGILRFEVIEKALTMPRPLTLIIDNWQQAWIFMCPAAVELLKDFEQDIYIQDDHTDNDGVNKWKTAIFYLK